MSSISATERIKLWNQFNDPVDQETIKSNFMRKINCKNPPFRFKLKPKPRVCAEIPSMVEFHYRNPPPLLPSLRDVLRCERVYKRYSDTEYNSIDLNDIIREDLTLINQRRLSTMSNDLLDAMKIQNEIHTNSAETERRALNDVQEIEEIKMDEQMECEKRELNGINDPITNGNGVIHENFSKKSINKRKRNTSLRCIGSECMDLLEIGPDEIKPKELKIDSIQIDEELKTLDMDVIKRLAFHQLNQLLYKNKDLVAMYQAKNANKLIAEALSSIPQKVTMPSQLLTTDDVARIAEQFSNSSASSLESGEHVEINSFSNKKTIVEPIMYINCFNHIQNDTEKAFEIAKRLEDPLRNSKIRARAVLTPVDEILKGNVWYTNLTIDDSIFMRYRNFSIGTNYECQMRFGKTIFTKNCSRISPLHATIFYDEVSSF